MATGAPSPRLVVLVVESEPFLRASTLEVLAQAGFAGIPAADADDAMRLLEQRPDVQIVFADVNIPGSVDGLTLARSISRRWPLMDILVTSAQAPVDIEDMPDQGAFLPKPYAPETLVRALRQFLEVER